jgi:hypothetical protein
LSQEVPEATSPFAQVSQAGGLRSGATQAKFPWSFRLQVLHDPQLLPHAPQFLLVSSEVHLPLQTAWSAHVLQQPFGSSGQLGSVGQH